MLYIGDEGEEKTSPFNSVEIRLCLMRRQEFDASFKGTIKIDGERERERNIHRGAVFIKTAFIFDRSEIQ